MKLLLPFYVFFKTKTSVHIGGGIVRTNEAAIKSGKSEWLWVGSCYKRLVNWLGWIGSFTRAEI